MAVISPGQTAFLRFEIENGDARRKKVALQEVARRYRKGDQFNAEGRNAFEKIINGIVLTDGDTKVVRWCLNALARLGSRQGCGPYVAHALKQFEDEPEIVAAAVAALARMYNGSLDQIHGLESVDPAIRILAAMQTTDVRNLDVSDLRIDIDRSNVEVLKLALLTVGLNRDIQNLLHPRHSNGVIVRQLADHDDHVVRQYSVWSVLENKRLTLADLGIPFEFLGKQPPNVQSKLLQLAAEREPDTRLRHGIIHDGTFNEHPEARTGLAKGLSTTYYEGLEDLTISWYDTEADGSIRALIAEHFARFSDVCGPYFDKVLAVVEADATMVDRLLLGAEGKPLYAAIKRWDIRGAMPDLFGMPTDLGRMFENVSPLKRSIVTMKVLFLAANPDDQSSLRLDHEARDLKEQLAMVREAQVGIEIEHAWGIRADQLQREVLNGRPTVLHFSGHGGPGSIIFEDATGSAVEVSGDALAGLVALTPTIRCVVLNSCFSASVATLVAPHAEAVIGCNVSIGDSAAILFTRAFYRALAHGQDFETAYRFAKNDLVINGQAREADKYAIILRP